MSQQPQVTTVSDPVAPNGDAAYISATTAPPSFVFKPGATFPNGGPVQQNTYNTAGLALLSGILKGAGLFPNIGLPASLVDLDFSLAAGSFAATGDIDFGANCSLRGLSTQPTLALGAHQLTTAPRLLKDVRITGTGAGPVFGSVPKLFELEGQSQVSGTNLFTIPNGVSVQVRVSDDSILGDSTNPSITIPNGANITVYLEDFSRLELNALVFTGTGSGTIIVGANAFIHPNYFTLGPNVSIITTPVTAPEVTYQPGGTAGSTVFTDFGALTAFIVSQSASSELVDWLIRVDGSLTGGTAGVPAGTYDFTGGPASLTFDGGDTMSDLSFDAETTILGPTKITFRNTVVSSANAVNPVWAPISEGTLILENASLQNTDVSYFMTATGAIFVLAQSNGGSFGWGSHCIFVDNGSFLVVGLFDVAGGATTFPVAADAFVTFTTPESTFLELDIYSPSILLDHSWFTKPGVCFFYAAPPPFVTFKPGAQNTSNVFDDITQVAGYLTSVNFAPNFAPVVNNWSIQIDLTSNGNAFVSAVAIDLGLATKLYGVRPTGVQPTLAATASMGSFDGEISDLAFIGNLAAPGPVFGINPNNFSLTGKATVTCDAGTTLFNVNAVGSIITLRDVASLGDGVNPCIAISAGTLTIYMRGGSTLPAGALAITGGAVSIIVEPGASIDDTYIGMGGVTITNLWLRTPMAIGNAGAQAIGDGSIAIGDGTVCNGTNCIALGANCNVIGNNAVAIGSNAASTHDGGTVFGSGGAQCGIVNYAANTISNATVKFSNIGITTFVTQADTTYSVVVRIVTTQTGGAGSPGVWVYEIVCRNIAGTLTIFNTLLTSDPALQNSNANTFAFSVSGAELVLETTGVIALNYHSSARFDWAEALNN